MIADVAELTRLKGEWAGVCRMKTRMQNLVIGTFVGAGFTGPAVALVVYNLPLLLAFDVLKQVLQQLAAEHHFVPRGQTLGKLMDAAKPSTSLAWLDWQGLRDGVLRRNEVAHDGVLHDSAVCMANIDLVERQLAAWRIV
jgi:hypothetical protein